MTHLTLNPEGNINGDHIVHLLYNSLIETNNHKIICAASCHIIY